MRDRSRGRHGGRSALVVLLALLLSPSCRLFQAAAEAPGKVFSRKDKDKVRPPQDVQMDVMRFADRFDAQIVQAAHDSARREGTPRARMRSLTWSIPARTAVLTIASGPRPNVNLVDMLVLVTLGRIVHEERRGEADDDEQAGVTLTEAYRSLEDDIWTVAKRSLDERELSAIRDVIDTWHKDNPEQTITTFVRLPNFERLVAREAERGKNLFEELGDLLSLDPLAGLEPAKREVAQARLLGERTLFYAQRAPLIFSAQAELLGLRLASMPQIEDALEKGGQISEAAAKLAETAAALPETIREEREKTIEQVSEELAKQRQGLLQDLESAEAPLERLLGEFRTTAEATKEMSAAVQGGVQSLDAFVARVSEPSTPADPEEPGRPFDVREYGEAASRIEAAAARVDGILEDLDRSQGEIAPLLDQASERLDRTVRRAATYALGVGVLLIGAAAGAALLLRRSPSRRA